MNPITCMTFLKINETIKICYSKINFKCLLSNLKELILFLLNTQ